MELISYFDAHCDTIYRCYMDGDTVQIPFGEDSQQQNTFFEDCHTLRENKGHIDLERAGKYGRYAQFFALFYDSKGIPQGEMWEICRQLHRRFLQELEENPERITHCCTGEQVDETVAAGRTAALLSVEGADLLDCDVHHLAEAADWGVRLMNPVWNRANRLCGTNCEEPQRGFSQDGLEFIREMERQAIYVDVSHLSDTGFWDLYRAAKRPMVASHSNSREICPHPRNLTDDMFRAIRDTGGVVGLNFYQNFVGEDPSMDALVHHVEHFLALQGEHTLCLGGDMDGCEKLAGGMEGLQDVPRLYYALADRWYSQDLLEDLFWNNLRKLL